MRGRIKLDVLIVLITSLHRPSKETRGNYEIFSGRSSAKDFTCSYASCVDDRMGCRRGIRGQGLPEAWAAGWLGFRPPFLKPCFLRELRSFFLSTPKLLMQVPFQSSESPSRSGRWGAVTESGRRKPRRHRSHAEADVECGVQPPSSPPVPPSRTRNNYRTPGVASVRRRNSDSRSTRRRVGEDPRVGLHGCCVSRAARSRSKRGGLSGRAPDAGWT
jgi:hypothetical protein